MGWYGFKAKMLSEVTLLQDCEFGVDCAAESSHQRKEYWAMSTPWPATFLETRRQPMESPQRLTVTGGEIGGGVSAKQGRCKAISNLYLRSAPNITARG